MQSEFVFSSESVTRGHGLDSGNVGGAVWEIPEDMQGDGGADASPAVDLSRVGELLFGGGCGSRLEEFAEAGSRIGEAPGRQLDMKAIERVDDDIGAVGRRQVVHPFILYTIIYAAARRRQTFPATRFQVLYCGTAAGRS